MGIRDEFITKRGGSEGEVFSMIKTKNGETYYFGDIFDEPLINPRKGNFSVWSIVAVGVKKSGSTDYPDIDKIIKNNASAVGSTSYGVHSVPKRNQPK
jgi:hypothetical protein